MADKPTRPDPDDSYSEAETDRRRDATIRAMIGMKPQPHQTPPPKAKTRTVAKGRVRQGKARS